MEDENIEREQSILKNEERGKNILTREKKKRVEGLKTETEGKGREREGKGERGKGRGRERMRRERKPRQEKSTGVSVLLETKKTMVGPSRHRFG